MRKSLKAIGILSGLAIAASAGVIIGCIDTRFDFMSETPIEARETTEGIQIYTEANKTQQKPPHEAREAYPTEATTTKSGELSETDKYLLAKIIMAEAESESLTGQALVGRVVLNRVESADFPNTIRDVIFEEGQFTPVGNGRFEAVEPDDSCKAAVHLISTGWDESQGATYLSTHETDWHRERLTFLFEKGAHRFYK